MAEDPSVAELVARARDNDQAAWNELVERYGRLVWSICRTFRLSESDALDVVQNVWLHLVETLDRLREPEALPGWLATTTRRECLRTKRRSARLVNGQWQELESDPAAPEDDTQVDQWLLEHERAVALRRAFADLPPRSKQLLQLLIDDPPCSYAEISRRLEMPIGAIGPTRARCLAKLREHPALTSLINGDDEFAEGGYDHESCIERR